MKKMYGSIIALALFFSTSFMESHANEDEMSLCATVASFAGFYSSMNGGDYYSAYFAAYGNCLENIDPIQ